ncbi:MAG: UDP-N-acetylmuramoyl-tripeptide--D-alanyl-D-alanine ligase [Phycisphaerales bacterium]|jgi:UDP-N-acetylmuramoyl-tripeptide--D-alanyl-D-alanine ligase|nr:UDP-N-acetylmuramoyl-tripeptide--D-alanyl-D-alanine ligase [Phycisphaerales bacterium]
MMETLGTLADMAGGIVAPEHRSIPVDHVGTDTRVPLEGHLFVALRGVRFDGHEHLQAAADSGAVAVMVRRGTEVPEGLAAIIVEDTIKALGRMAAAWRRSLPHLRVVAITGTAGKTTTKDALAAVCRVRRRTVASPRSFNNDIGVPLTVLAARPGDEVLVAEVGTNAPGEIEPLAAMLRPDVAVVTLVGPGHLAGLGSVEAVAREKYTLLGSLRENGTGILRHQGLPVPQCRGSLRSFGRCDEADEPLIDRGPGWMEFDARRWQIALPGEHGAFNALAVILAARAIGLDDETIEQGLASAKSSPQRLSRRRVGSIDVIDDTWNANPDSMAATLAALPELVQNDEQVVLVLGDMLELGSSAEAHHRGLAEHLRAEARRVPTRQIVLVGPEMRSLMDELGGACGPIPVLHEAIADDQCMARIASMVSEGETVLLKGSRGLALERVISAMESGDAAT